LAALKISADPDTITIFLITVFSVLTATSPIYGSVRIPEDGLWWNIAKEGERRRKTPKDAKILFSKI